MILAEFESATSGFLRKLQERTILVGLLSYETSALTRLSYVLDSDARVIPENSLIGAIRVGDLVLMTRRADPCPRIRRAGSGPRS